MPRAHPSRRTAIRSGLAALASMAALPALERAGAAVPLLRRMMRTPSIDPVLRLHSLGPSELIGGLPFSPTWYADAFGGNILPFHNCERCESFPAPEESVDIAIIGGGLSGLASAYLLRDRSPVVFELRPRLGGQAMGESFESRSWSLASAYFMQDDKDSELGKLYADIGVDRHWRQDAGGFHFEYDGVVGADLLGPDPTREELLAIEHYAKAVAYFADEAYPDLPFEGPPSRLIHELDSRTFEEDIRLRCGTIPPRLAYMIQAYCASSFGVGFRELNAAAGWNFVAAEEFGRNVLPAGNAGLARALWNAARGNAGGGDDGDDGDDGHHGGHHLDGGSHGGARFRCNALVAEVKPVDDGVLIHWRDAAGTPRTTHARQVVMANAKQIVRHMMPWLDESDPDKKEAMQLVPTVAYLVANVVLDRPIGQDFYDLFIQGSAQFPMDEAGFEGARLITDVLNAGFATHGPNARALTLYWPLPWHTARFSIVDEGDWRAYAELARPQLAEMLALLGIAPRDVRQIRLSRWGHAMPYATPGAYSSGLPHELRRPLHGGRIWFANQDNWLLPAVETCLLEAMWVAPQVEAALG